MEENKELYPCLICSEKTLSKPDYNKENNIWNKQCDKKHNISGITLFHIIQSQAVHDYTYDYSKANYTKGHSKVIIICKIHGEFEQRFNNHISREHGCPNCGRIRSNMSKRNTVDHIMETIKNVHGDTYNYSKTVFGAVKDKIIITCKIHGDFDQLLSGHLSGRGCRKCNSSPRLTLSEWINIANKKHNNTYDYSKVTSYKAHSHVTIICPVHGEFSQTPYLHIHSFGCSKCSLIEKGKKRRLPYPRFIERARLMHQDTYDYPCLDYETLEDYIKIYCNICKFFFIQRAGLHLSGNGCVNCLNKTEARVYDFLEKSFEPTRSYKPNWCINPKTAKHLPFDIFIKNNDISVIIEIDGKQHFENVKYWKSSYEYNSSRDIYKMSKALKNNHNVIRIIQKDIFDNKINWKEALTTAINNCTENCDIQYIAKDISIYDTHKEKMKNFLENIDHSFLEPSSNSESSSEIAN